MTALTDFNLRAYTNIKHTNYILLYCVFADLKEREQDLSIMDTSRHFVVKEDTDL